MVNRYIVEYKTRTQLRIMAMCLVPFCVFIWLIPSSAFLSYSYIRLVWCSKKISDCYEKLGGR